MIGPLRRCIYPKGPDAIREIWAYESIINTSVPHLFEFRMTCVRIPTAWDLGVEVSIHFSNAAVFLIHRSGQRGIGWLVRCQLEVIQKNRFLGLGWERVVLLPVLMRARQYTAITTRLRLELTYELYLRNPLRWCRVCEVKRSNPNVVPRTCNDAIQHGTLNAELGMKARLGQQVVPRRQYGKLEKNKIAELPTAVLHTSVYIPNARIQVNARPIYPM